MKSFTQKDIDELDRAILSIYPQLGGGELTQLAKLFTGQRLLRALENVLRPTLGHTRRPMEKTEVRLAWTDKRPYALMKGEAAKVELADLAIYHFDTQLWKGGQRTLSRCLLLQAKAAKTSTQLSAPTACLNPPVPKANSTTGRELRLLSSWPEFDLYLGANSANPVASGLNVEARHLPAPHGWFIGTPFISPGVSNASAWPSPWMCAPAELGHPCDETLGSLLVRHLSWDQVSGMTKKSVGAGAPFDYNPKDLDATTPTCTDWNRLCVEIIRAVRRDVIPGHLTPGVNTSKLQHGVLYSFPVWPAVQYAMATINEYLYSRQRHGMPVLIIARVFDEREM